MEEVKVIGLLLLFFFFIFVEARILELLLKM